MFLHQAWLICTVPGHDSSPFFSPCRTLVCVCKVQYSRWWYPPTGRFVNHKYRWRRSLLRYLFMFTAVECVSALVRSVLFLILDTPAWLFNFNVQHVQPCLGWVVRAGQGSVKYERWALPSLETAASDTGSCMSGHGCFHASSIPCSNTQGPCLKLTQARTVNRVWARHACCIRTHQMNWTLGSTWATSVKTPFKDDNGRNYSDTIYFHFLKKIKGILDY